MHFLIQKTDLSNFYHIAIETTMTAGSAFMLYGTQIAIISAIVHVIFCIWIPLYHEKEKYLSGKFSFLNPVVKVISLETLFKEKRAHLFSLEQLDQHVEYGIKYFKIFLIAQIIMGTQLLVSGVMINQIPIRILRYIINYEQKKIPRFFFLSCVFSPFIEEGFFRGFLLNLIKRIQKIFHLNINSNFQKSIRVGIQSLVFGFSHFHPLQGKMNSSYILGTSLGGMYLGSITEETKNLWSSIFVHTALNFSVFLRVIVIKT